MLPIRDIYAIDFEVYLSSSDHGNRKKVLIATSGFETRAIHLTKLFLENELLAPSDVTVFGFTEFDSIPTRKQNDNFYTSHGITPVPVSSSDIGKFETLIKSQMTALVEASHPEMLDIHIDYSSMPRGWYCRVLTFMRNIVRSMDRVFMWYAPGEYVADDFPVAHVSDFHLFSGSPNLSSRFRTHVLGLGFDSIRSLAIWSILDPENVVCFYADPAVRQEYAAKVIKDNADVLAASQENFHVSIRDFSLSFSKIVSVCTKYLRQGDVILVPDGPKPLVLATSLVPAYIAEPGIVCFHVTSKPARNYRPADVQPLGEVIGFHCRLSDQIS